MSSSFACGVFTSWKKQVNSNSVVVHFAVNRFVGEDLIHYDLPSNNLNKANKKRISLYIELEVDKDSLAYMFNDDIECITFVDTRFNNIIFKSTEYVLELSYTTKPSVEGTREKEGKVVHCYSFPMLPDTIVSISGSGTHLWSEDRLNTKKIEIDEALNIISNSIVRVPNHIKSRKNAIVI